MTVSICYKESRSDPRVGTQLYWHFGRKEGNILYNDALNTFYLRVYGVRHMVKDHSDSERGTRCRHIGYVFQLTARVLLYASSHRQDNTYHSLCYTSLGALAGTRNSSMGLPHEGSIRRLIALITELHLAPGIRNEKADSAAKSALDLTHAKVDISYNNFKYCVSQYILSTWQDDWNGAVTSKLHSVKPVLGDWQSSYRRCKKDEGVLCRARIGHTHLTHSYILRKGPPPQCEHCHCILTVCHILVECNHFAQERKYIFDR